MTSSANTAETVPSEDPITSLRDRGASAFVQHGLPTQRVEQWKYTNLRKFVSEVDLDALAPDTHIGRQAQLKDLPERVLDLGSSGLEAARLVMVNGAYRAKLSRADILPSSVWIGDIDTWLARDDATSFNLTETLAHLRMDTADRIPAALNAHYFTNGLMIYVPKNTRVTVPIELVQLTLSGDDKTYSYPRNAIIVEEGAEVTLIEHVKTAAKTVSMPVTHIRVGKNATCHHIKWLEDAPEAQSYHSNDIVVDRDANYHGFALTTGNGVTRHETHGELVGDNATLDLSGSYLLSERGHCDTTIILHHKALHGTSNQTFKAVLGDHARGVFQGKIHVHRDAQKTDGYQLNNAILLSDTAEMDVKPELEIYADDVQCSHGATTGQLDQAPLFYLRSRGLPEAEAKKLLLHAFLGEAFDHIKHDALRDVLFDNAIKVLDNLVS